MKIVFTVATYWPKQDGVQMVTSYHAETLVKKGHEVVVITSRVANAPDREIHNGVHIVRAEAYNYLYWHKGDKQDFQKIVLEESQNADALVAVCLQSFAADWILPIIKDISCQKILYMHGMPDFRLHRSDFISIYNVAKTIFRNIRWSYFYKRNWAKIKQFDAAIHLFLNDNSHRYFKEHGYDKNYIIENSCDRVFFDKESINEWGCKNKMFLYVGNYCQRKNQIEALRTFYATKSCNISLVFVGSVRNKYCIDLEKERENLNKKYGIRDVKILVGLSREEIIKLTQKCYCTIMSSTYEFYPIVTIESMASGVPFISTDVGIVRFLPGGIIVHSREDMAYWIDLLSSNESIRNELGNIGKNYAKNHLFIDEKVKQLEEIVSQGKV